MTNDPEIREAVLNLHAAHVELLRAMAELVKALPAAIVADDPYSRLVHALDGETDCLRALAGLVEWPSHRAEMYRVIVEALEGKR